MVPKGTKVKVFVDFFPVLDPKEMNVIGESYMTAKMTLEHFNVEFIKTEGLKNIEDGIVVNQEPYFYSKHSNRYKGGDPEYADYYSPFESFKVYLAGKKIKTPLIIGKTMKEAKLILGEYDISIGETFF